MTKSPSIRRALVERVHRLTVRAQISILCLALALPFAAYSIAAAVAEARTERDHVAEEVLGSAKLTAARLDDHLNDVRAILTVLSASVVFDSESTQANDAYLRRLASKVPAYLNNLTVWNVAGDNIGSMDARLRANGGVNLSNRRFFRDAMAGGAMSVEAPAVSISNGSRVSVFAMPVLKDGRVIGVVGAATRLDALQAHLETGLHLPPGAVMTVVGEDRTILARSIDASTWVGRKLPSASDAVVPARSNARERVVYGPSADGIDRVAGVATATVAHWQVFVGVPTNVALAPVYARLRNSLGAAACMLLVGLILAAHVGEGIASPLRQLSEDAAQLGAGQLGHRTTVGGSKEASQLAGTLNHMAHQLEERSAQLSASRNQLHQITDNLPALVSYLDADKRFRFANLAYRDWLGQDPAALIGKSLPELYGKEIYNGFKAHIEHGLEGHKVQYERTVTTLAGPRQFDIVLVPDIDPGLHVRGLFVLMTDVTAHRQAQAALSQSERRLKMVADNIPAMVTYVDSDERYRFVNAHLGHVFHADPKSLLGKTLRETGGERLYAAMAPHVAKVLRGEETVFEGTWTVKTRTYHYQSTYVPDTDDQGVVRGYYAMTFDISAMKETQRQLDLLARVDVLTGLPNRRLFEERLLDAMARARRTQDPLALMFLDIDHFKSINDSLGHGVGDSVLKEFAIRLKNQVRETDMVARLAGDEFVVLLEGIGGTAQLTAVATKIVNAVRAPFALVGPGLRVTTSVGVAAFDGGEEAPTDLLATADKALYAAKRQGRDRFSIAHPAPAQVYELPTSAARGRASA